jgi:hypothetical protein
MAQMTRDHQDLARLLFEHVDDFEAFAAGLTHILDQLNEALGR